MRAMIDAQEKTPPRFPLQGHTCQDMSLLSLVPRSVKDGKRRKEGERFRDTGHQTEISQVYERSRIWRSHYVKDLMREFYR